MKGLNLTDQRLWGWLAIALAIGGVLYVLSPILAPFLAGAILAYILNPLVARIAGSSVRRTLAVLFVLFLALLAVVAVLLIVLPLFTKELRLLAEKLPDLLRWLNQSAVPWLAQHLGIELQLDLESVKEMVSEAVKANQELLPRLLSSLQIGGMAILGIVVNLLLIPVVLFYLLRDWNNLLARIDGLIPRHLHGRARTIALEIDAVLAEFLRGQLLVMLVMAVYYVIALWIAKLQFALPIGLLTGLLVFIPYVGAVTGFVLGTLAALLQFNDFAGVAWVWVAFTLGQVLEGMVVTPILVGERIGLHPVAVIFALLAFGSLFGFFGVLLALPASAALLVALRHLRAAYLASPLYGGQKG
jgi:predicted PurR-regulated permease PerM